MEEASIAQVAVTAIVGFRIIAVIEIYSNWNRFDPFVEEEKIPN